MKVSPARRKGEGKEIKKEQEDQADKQEQEEVQEGLKECIEF